MPWGLPTDRTTSCALYSCQMFDSLPWFASLVLVAVQIALEVVIVIRVVMRRLPVGSALAWIVVTLFVPLIGPLAYLVVGENRLGARRARAARELEPTVASWVGRIAGGDGLDWSGAHPDARELARFATNTLGMPPVAGTALELVSDTHEALRRLIADIDAARTTVDLEYYIWWPGGLADDVAEAVMRASGRGVRCRVLVDAVGSAAFLRSDWPRRMRTSGVEVAACMPVGVLRALFVRLDLRNHRKIAVVDGEVAHTGSRNLADHTLFRQETPVGAWVDASVVVRGPAVHALAAVFELDWALETGDGVHEPPEVDVAEGVDGGMPVQVLPSGPGDAPDAIQQVVLTAIYGARSELVVSTPYFVPDEATLRALGAAAYGGIRVVLIVPARNDHPLVALACRAAYQDLLEAGVEIWEFQRGLLHSKTVVVDRTLALVGSLNMDMRSFWLNFEITLAVYGPSFSRDLRELQEGYLADSHRIDPEAWRRQPRVVRFMQNTARLASPLL